MKNKFSFLGGFALGFFLLSNITHAEKNNNINIKIDNSIVVASNPFVPVAKKNDSSLNAIKLDLLDKKNELNTNSKKLAEKNVIKESEYIMDNYIVRKGNYLKLFLDKSKIDKETIKKVIYETKNINKISSLKIGQKISIEKTKENELNRIILEINDLDTVQLIKTKENNFIIKDVEKEYQIVKSYAEGIITDTLYNSAYRSGLNKNQVNQMISIFDWNIDFKRDVKKGDSFKVLFEEKYVDNKKVGTGEILSVKFNLSNKYHMAFLYIDESGNKNYYNEYGMGLGKSFIRHPIQNARISSHFNPRRMHPVHNRVLPHKGVDYAAPTGTPIRTTGDGVITFLGVNGGYGKTVVVDHGNGYTTLYAHMVRFQKGLKNGSRVSQKDIIGFVGKTGTATGPHLHYEFRINGVHKDPIKVSLPDNAPIPIRYASDFEKKRNNYIAMINEYKKINNTYTASIKNNNKTNIN